MLLPTGLVAALVVAALVAAGLARVLRAGGGPRRGPSVLGPAGPLVAAGAGVVGLLVVLLGAVGLFGVDLRGGRVDEGEGGSLPEPATTVPTTTAAAAVPPSGQAVEDVAPLGAGAGGAVLGPVVQLRAEDEDEGERFSPAPPDAVGGLAPGTVLQVRVRGFPPFAPARALQCVTTTTRSCGNAAPVQFDGDGMAFFQYLASDDFSLAASAGRCRAGAAPCALVVEEVDGDARARRLTVFHDALPPPGRIRVTPSRGLTDGQRVTVEVQGYPPGAAVQAMLCAPPAATGVSRCGAPGPTAPMTVGADGTGRTELVIRTGPVGAERRPCRHGEACGVSVAGENVFARAPVAPIGFATPPGAAYDPSRLAAGLATAALLLAVAAWLVRRTDWTPPGEAAAPEIDNAEYADLDAIVAALPPERDADHHLGAAAR